MTCYEKFKQILRDQGARVNITNQADRDSVSRYEELAIYAPGKPLQLAMAVIYSDGSYSLFVETDNMRMSEDAAFFCNLERSAISLVGPEGAE